MELIEIIIMENWNRLSFKSVERFQLQLQKKIILTVDFLLINLFDNDLMSYFSSFWVK